GLRGPARQCSLHQPRGRQGGEHVRARAERRRASDEVPTGQLRGQRAAPLHASHPARDSTGPPAQPRRYASASILTASSKSLSVSPPSVWVECVPVTLLYDITWLGWSVIAFAIGLVRFTKPTEPLKS